MFGSTEIIVIVLVIFVLFGAAAIPKFARSLGQAKKEFEQGVKSVDDPSSNSSEPKEALSTKTSDDKTPA